VRLVGIYLVSLLLLGPGCVLDRTGQSVTSAAQREMVIQASRVAEAQRLTGDLERRVLEMEEVLRYRGQQQAEKLENLDQVTAEIRRMRGDLELIQHTSSQESAAESTFKDDASFRLQYSENRIQALEKALGLSAPPMPVVPQKGEGAVDGAVQEKNVVPDDKAVEQESGDLFELGQNHQKQGRHQAARAVYARFIAETEEDDRLGEARFRYAETWYSEGLYQQAILKLEDVVKDTPDSNWAAWAMVRQGECFQKMDRMEEAELFWEDVLSRHPDTAAALQARTLLNR